MGTGLLKHRVNVNIEVKLDIYDNWTPEEVALLLSGVIGKWYDGNKAADDTVEVNYVSGYTILSNERIRELLNLRSTNSEDL